MKVLVIGMNGMGLMPTTPRKARILVRSGKAVVERRIPYTIRLVYKTGSATQPLVLGEDTGNQNIGISIRSGKKVLDKAEWRLRSSMEKRKLLETRASYRRGRRYRNTPYRHPKYHCRTKRVYIDTPIKRNGRLTHWKKISVQMTSPRPEGWLPPSLQSKVDHHIRITKRYMEALPKSTKVTMEVGRFDIARMKDPTVHGEDYQHGQMYDFENIKAYVFSRDEYTCQVCHKKAGSKRTDGSVVKIRAHHIDFKSKGATDNPDRMVTVCDRCHTAKAHKPGGVLYKWMTDNKEFKRGYRDATVMNILRRRMWRAFPEAKFTYGNITKADREKLGLKKTHANDAVAISCKGEDIKSVEDTVETTIYVQMRKKKRSLHEATPRKGRKEPNRAAKRNPKNTKAANGFCLCDKVCFDGKVGWITGFTSNEAYIKDIDGEYIFPDGQKYKHVACKKINLVSHNNNWGCQVTKTTAPVSHD